MPDTRTLGTMIDRIGRELVRADLTAEIREAIATSIDYYSNDRFWFNEAEATAGITVGVDIYDLPTDYLALDHLHMEDTAGQKYELVPMTFEEVQEIQTQTPGFPRAYAIYRDLLYIRPVPNIGYRLRMNYLRDIGLTANASEAITNAWTTDAEKLIRCDAKAEVFEHRIRLPAQAERMRSAAMREWRNLRGRTVQYTYSGVIQKTQF